MVDIELMRRLAGGQAQYAELAASQPNRRAWLVISPFKYHEPGPPPGDYESLPWKYRVRCFEVDQVMIEGGYDVHEEEMYNLENAVVDNEHDLAALILKWLPDPTQLRPRPGDCPI